MEKDIRDFRICYIPMAGHFVQEEQPELVNEHLLTFLTARSLPV
jgi:pimeloyl-ACP methyl ester carboxylesterase